MGKTGKIFYSLKEVRSETGLPASTLRYWETQFEQLQPRKDGHGNRYYTQEDIALIKRIKFIRDDKKITRIEAIRRELATNEKGSDAKQRATDILVRLRSELVALRKLIYDGQPLPHESDN